MRALLLVLLLSGCSNGLNLCFPEGSGYAVAMVYLAEECEQSSP